MTDYGIPKGIKAAHTIITDRCRMRGDAVALLDALSRMRTAAEAILTGRRAGLGERFHLVLVIERKPEEDRGSDAKRTGEPE